MRELKIAEVEVRRVSWSTIGAFECAAGAWRERHGCLVMLRDSGGLEGVGEAAPLPGISVDDIDGCEAALRRTLRRSACVRLDTAGIEWALGELASELRATPAGLFAAETAWLDLVARRRAQSVASLLREIVGVDDTADRLEVAAVLDGPPETWSAEAMRSAERGIRCVKVKIGKLPWELERRRLDELRVQLSQAIVLRLDLNGAWRGLEPDEVGRRLRSLRSLRTSLVEEPVPLAQVDPRMLEVLRDRSVPIAADESMRPPTSDAEIADWMERHTCGALVIKPTVVGGIVRSIALARIAKSRGGRFMISHALEGPIAYAACCEIALALGGADPAGLDRHVLLAGWADEVIPHFATNAIRATRRTGLGVNAARVLDAANAT